MGGFYEYFGGLKGFAKKKKHRTGIYERKDEHRLVEKIFEYYDLLQLRATHVRTDIRKWYCKLQKLLKVNNDNVYSCRHFVEQEETK